MSTVESKDKSTAVQQSTWWGFFWIILLLFLLFFIYLTLTQRNSGIAPTLIVNSPNENGLGSIDSNESIPQVGTLQRCRNLNGVLLPQRYYDPNNNWTVEAINPADAPGTNICLSFCQQVSDNITCEVEDDRYTDCLNKISPTNNSNGEVLPVAKDGNIPFYAIGIDRVGCYP